MRAATAEEAHAVFLLPIEVETYAGGRSDEAPRVLHGFDGPVEIDELLDRWYEAAEDPSSRTFDYFRVRGTDGECAPMFPIYPSDLTASGNFTIAALTDGNVGEGGVLALGATNALYFEP